MKKPKHLSLKILVLFIFYFVVGKVLGLERLVVMDIMFCIYCNIIALVFLSKLVSTKMHFILKVILTTAIVCIMCFGDFVAMWFSYKEHFQVVNNKVVIIKASSTLHDSYINLYQLKFLIYKKPLNVGKQGYNGAFDPYDSGDYKLPSDIEKYLD